MNRLLQEQGGRVLAFGAHPDDLEVGAGGLLARLSAQGAEVTMAIVSIPNRPAERRAEAEAAADMIDAELFVLNEDKPCRVEDIPMHELVRRMDQLVGDVRPDLVITHSANDLHWDHGLVNRATVSALRRTRCDLLAFLSSPEMNAQSRTFGNCFADISSFIEIKVVGDRLPHVTARQARPRVVARSGARDGPDQRVRVRGGLRDAARPGVNGGAASAATRVVGPSCRTRRRRTPFLFQPKRKSIAGLFTDVVITGDAVRARHGGRVFERYHARSLGTQREVRNCLSYVPTTGGITASIAARAGSSTSTRARSRSTAGRTRPRRALQRAPPSHAAVVVWRPRVWLPSTGWLRHGLVSIREVPGGDEDD